jgi:ribosomal protein L18
MSYLKNKLQEKLRRYMRRKHRVNETIKAQNPEYRLLVERSNLYVKAQVLGRDGKVIASTTDKGAS